MLCNVTDTVSLPVSTTGRDNYTHFSWTNPIETRKKKNGHELYVHTCENAVEGGEIMSAFMTIIFLTQKFQQILISKKKDEAVA